MPSTAAFFHAKRPGVLAICAGCRNIDAEMSNGRLGDNLEDNALLCFLLKSPSFQTASRRDVLVLVQPLSVWILLIGAGHARQWCMTLPEVRFRISIRPAMSDLILGAVTRLPIYVTLGGIMRFF